MIFDLLNLTLKVDLLFKKIDQDYDFWIRGVTYCCYLHMVAAGELCCLSVGNPHIVIAIYSQPHWFLYPMWFPHQLPHLAILTDDAHAVIAVIHWQNVSYTVTYCHYTSAFGPELAYRLRVAQPTLMDVTRYFWYTFILLYMFVYYIFIMTSPLWLAVGPQST